jgi:tRNA 2-thiouridine synthesizing protein A
MADKTLDAKGLNCPLPILKTKKMLTQVPAGGTLEVLATDLGSVAELLESTKDGDVFRFVIKHTA